MVELLFYMLCTERNFVQALLQVTSTFTLIIKCYVYNLYWNIPNLTFYQCYVVMKISCDMVNQTQWVHKILITFTNILHK